MMLKLAETQCHLTGSDVATPVSDDEELVSYKHIESLTAAAQGLGWKIQGESIRYTYSPANDDVEVALLDEGSERIVESLSPFLLGDQAHRASVFIVGLNVLYKGEDNKKLVVVILVDSHYPLLHTGPPELPHGVGHHVHLTTGPISSDLVVGNSIHTSASDTLSYMPWIGEDVVPGRAIFDLPFSMTAAVDGGVEKSVVQNAHRSSIGLVLSLPVFPHDSHFEPSPLVVEPRQLYALTCGYHLLPERAIPSHGLPDRHSRHLHHQKLTLGLKVAARNEVSRQNGRLQRATTARLQAAGDDTDACQSIQDQLSRQISQQVKPFQDAFDYHDGILNNPHADTAYHIGDIVLGQNTIVINNDLLRPQATLPASSSTPSTSAVQSQLPVMAGSSSAPLLDPVFLSPRDCTVMDWSLIKLAPDVTAANILAVGRTHGAAQPIYMQPEIAVARVGETLTMYRNNTDAIHGQYVGAVAYELRHQNVEFPFPSDIKSGVDAVPNLPQKQGGWVQHRHMVQSTAIPAFALQGDPGNIVINGKLQPVGIISRATILPTNQSLVVLCDLKSIFAHIETLQNLPRGSIKIITKSDVA